MRQVQTMCRYLEYTKNSCIWGLLDCDCSSNGGSCLKIQNDSANCSLYMFDSDDDDDGKIVSICTDLSNTLEARMNRYKDTYLLIFLIVNEIFIKYLSDY